MPKWYRATFGDNGVPDTKHVHPFDKRKKVTAVGYPAKKFEEFDTGILGKGRARNRDGASRLKFTLANMQPGTLGAAAIRRGI